MNFTRPYNCLVVAVLIVLYLAFPAASLACAVSPETGVSSARSFIAPGDTCPCSDGQSSECCDMTFCTCACHIPLGQGTRLVYAPVIYTQSFREHFWSLPQVFLSIFVPPQNIPDLL